MKIFNLVYPFLFMTTLIGCNETNTNVSNEPSVEEKSVEVKIPMSDAHENNRYFLLSRVNDNGIEKIQYLRKGDTSDVYGKMEIKCPQNKIRKVSTDDKSIVDSLDIGDWYTPTSDWTDADIVNFICK